MEAKLRKDHGLTVVAVQRCGQTFINPDAGLALVAGDRVHVFGEQDLISRKADLFLGTVRDAVQGELADF